MHGILSAILLAGGLGGLAWWGWDSVSLFAMHQITSDSRPRETIWDLGPTLSPMTLLVIRLVSAVAAGILVLVMTHNLGETVVMGFLGSTLPMAVINRQRQQRRALLDTQCYTMSNSLRLLLPISTNAVDALRDMRDSAEDPLKSVLAAALRSETRTTGTVTEFIRQVGHDLHLDDMELLGDVLGQVRTQTTRASVLLENLVKLWGERLQMEQRRLGKMTSSSRLGSIMIIISLGIQLGWPAISASARATDGHLIGQVFGFFAALVTAGAWLTLQGQTRKAMKA